MLFKSVQCTFRTLIRALEQFFNILAEVFLRNNEINALYKHRILHTKNFPQFDYAF